MYMPYNTYTGGVANKKTIKNCINKGVSTFHISLLEFVFLIRVYHGLNVFTGFIYNTPIIPMIPHT